MCWLVTVRAGVTELVLDRVGVRPPKRFRLYCRLILSEPADAAFSSVVQVKIPFTNESDHFCKRVV